MSTINYLHKLIGILEVQVVISTDSLSCSPDLLTILTRLIHIYNSLVFFFSHNTTHYHFFVNYFLLNDKALFESNFIAPIIVTNSSATIHLHCTKLSIKNLSKCSRYFSKLQNNNKWNLVKGNWSLGYQIHNSCILYSYMCTCLHLYSMYSKYISVYGWAKKKCNKNIKQ